MGVHSQNQKRFQRSCNMRDHLFLLPLAILVSPLLCQLKFSGGVSSSSNSNSNSPNRNTNNKPTLADRHQEEEGRISTERRGFSYPQVKAAPAMEGEGGKLLARMSLVQDSLAASLVDNSHTVATAVTTLSPSTTTTTGSTATSRTRISTTRTRASTTRASATRTPGGASVT